MVKKVLLAAALVAGASAMPPIRPDDFSFINDLKFIDFLNTEKSTWTAGVNKRFEGMNYQQARGLLGTSMSHISEHMDDVLDSAHYNAIADADIPAEFNSVTQWKGLVHPIRDQQQCGSCWAFSASEVLSDRIAIASGKPGPVLSAEDLVSCDKQDMGCSGGTLPSAWGYLEQTGVVTDSCMPYVAGNGTAEACPSQCVDSESFQKYKASKVYAIDGVSNMQKEIMTNGPIQVAFMVYKSFMSYTSGVYKKKFYEIIPEGGHAVKIVGWGTESGQDYWLVANSWGTSWGEDGFFKIGRGTNACGIEKQGPPYAGLPAV